MHYDIAYILLFIVQNKNNYLLIIDELNFS